MALSNEQSVLHPKQDYHRSTNLHTQPPLVLGITLLYHSLYITVLILYYHLLKLLSLYIE